MRFAGMTGMSSIRSPYTTSWIFCPGSRPNLLRISFGITTWNLGETVTAVVCPPSIVLSYYAHRIDGSSVCQDPLKWPNVRHQPRCAFSAGGWMP